MSALETMMRYSIMAQSLQHLLDRKRPRVLVDYQRCVAIFQGICVFAAVVFCSIVFLPFDAPPNFTATSPSQTDTCNLQSHIHTHSLRFSHQRCLPRGRDLCRSADYQIGAECGHVFGRGPRRLAGMGEQCAGSKRSEKQQPEHTVYCNFKLQYVLLGLGLSNKIIPYQLSISVIASLSVCFHLYLCRSHSHPI